MRTHSEFSEEPSSVPSEVTSKFIIINYREIFKKVLERLCVTSKNLFLMEHEQSLAFLVL